MAYNEEQIKILLNQLVGKSQRGISRKYYEEQLENAFNRFRVV